MSCGEGNPGLSLPGSLRLSVALCTFQGARFLEAQLESIAGQTRIPDELVVCDDRSSDETVAIVRAFARRAPFPVRIEVNPVTLRSTKNFERAIGLCAGDLIATCDQDDVWLPEKIALTLAAFEEDPRRGLVFTDAEVVDEDLRPRGYLLWDSVFLGSRQRRLFREGRGLEVLLRQWAVTGTTMTFRASWRPLVLPIPGVWVHDAWIALLAGAVSPVGLVERPTVRYRQHASQQIGAARLTWMGMYRLARTIGPEFFRLDVERFRLARERLGAARERLPDPGILALLDAKVAHHELRLAISEDPSRLSRIRTALGELGRGGYARFSPRTSHVLKDLFL
jgi:glycosyltransferase involved in cell wall biosynthesis